MSLFEKPKTGGMFDAPSASMFGGKALGGAFAPPEPEPDEFDGLPPEERAERVLSEAEQGFKDRAQAEAKRFELATDSEYWAALCFQSRAQKEQFLRALVERFGLEDDGDKYLDGWQVAKAMGITLEREDVPYNTSEGKQDRKWLSLTR